MDTKPPDEFHDDIALRLMEGDESVLGDILQHYGPALEKAIDMRFTPLAAEDAEEVAADAVLRLWQHRRHYDPCKASVRTLLYRIAVNRAKDVIALGWQKARRTEEQVDPDFLSQFEAPEEMVELPPDDEKLRNDVNVALSVLSEHQRRILETGAFAGSARVKDSVLAKELGIPVARVAVERHRGKKKLAERLKLLGHVFECEGASHE